MKKDLMPLVKWFCRKLTYNALASVVPIMLEILSGTRKDIKLKPDDDKPPHYRNYRVDTHPPLTKKPKETRKNENWKQLLKEYKQKHGKSFTPVNRRGGEVPPAGCHCKKCGAPGKYLSFNNGKLASQVRCKVCKKVSSIHRNQRQSLAKYWCPHCANPLYRWKDSANCTIFKCQNNKCRHYLRKKGRLTKEEANMRKKQKYNPNFKLRYQYREYHIDPETLIPARPEDSKIDLRKIHNNFHVVGLVLSFTVNLGLSSRVTRNALKGLFNINISHQTVINYVNAVACQLADYVDKNSPRPSGIAAADETYINVEKKWHYTWFIIDATSRAVCGYNLSNSRNTEPALSLLYNCYGKPSDNRLKNEKLITDGNASYDRAVMTYNSEIPDGTHNLIKKTVIGLENLDSESEEYRAFKQLIERLNRTYKYHTRPRAGFKTFNGAVTLTTLFVAYYNFMRPHSALNGNVPVKLDCLKGNKLMPDAWITLLQQAA